MKKKTVSGYIRTSVGHQFSPNWSSCQTLRSICHLNQTRTQA